MPAETTLTLAIDPGNIDSAFVLLQGDQPCPMPGSFGKVENERLAGFLREWSGSPTVVIEMIACYGMAVGAEVFETVYWIGRFTQIAVDRGLIVHRRFRKDVKLHHCHSPKAKDGNIRQAVIDRFGGKEAAIGKKTLPGPLYGVAADVWQALALGLMFVDQQEAA